MDDDVFFHLIPCNSSATQLIEHSEWYRPAYQKHRPIGSREPTPGPEFHDEADLMMDRLTVTFSALAEGPRPGLQFGVGDECDVVFADGDRAKALGVSRKHFCISTDAIGQILLHDENSTCGTAVETDRQNGEEMRRGTSWVLYDPPGARDRFEEIIIKLGMYAMRLHCPNHATPSEAYREKFWRFRDAVQAHNAKEAQLGRLRLSVTGPVTGTATPALSQGPVFYLDKRNVLGKGSFGKVYRTFRMSDGAVFAAKIATGSTSMSKEYKIMLGRQHINLVRIHAFKELPEPTIIMDYYPDGNLQEATLSKSQYISAFGQVLDGLKYLHEHNVVHRDIKPGNLLLQRSPGLKVAISDFGLAREVESQGATTFCGSTLYVAPEIVRKEQHNRLVDIWSLGVVILGWIYGLPAGKRAAVTGGIGWHGRLMKVVWCKTQALDQMLHGMVVDLLSRREAKDLLDSGVRKGLFTRRHDLLECPFEDESLISQGIITDVSMRTSSTDSPTLRGPQCPQLARPRQRRPPHQAGRSPPRVAFVHRRSRPSPAVGARYSPYAAQKPSKLEIPDLR